MTLILIILLLLILLGYFPFRGRWGYGRRGDLVWLILIILIIYLLLR